MKTNEQHGQLTGPGELRIVRVLPGPIERAWTYLTDDEKRSRWLAAGHMEQGKGGKVTLQFRHKDLAPDETPPDEYTKHHNEGHTMEGVITRWEPPRVLAYTFGSTGDSEVTFELSEEGKNVLLVLTHCARGEDVDYMHEFAPGWHTHLTHLIAQLEGGPRPPFWSLFTRLHADYARLMGPKTTP